MTINETPATDTEVLDVDFHHRTIELVVVPFEEPTLVPFQGEVWEEVFAASAFSRLDPQRTIRVNRDHDRSKTVGKVTAFDTGDPRGLIAHVKIAKTLLGDETLQLASEDCLSASIGFGVRRDGVIVNSRTRSRRIIDAVIDHVSLVEQPAYSGAKVLSVRSATPRLDSLRRDPVLAWAEMRCDPTMRWARRRTQRISR
jgi:HK97 family phage prohead protease